MSRRHSERAVVSKREEIDADEAFAFLGVVAPKLEQLRGRLSAAKTTLHTGDPESARLNAIVESQLAIKEFLSGIANLVPLVEPIDVLLEAVREEPVEPVTEEELSPEPADEP